MIPVQTPNVTCTARHSVAVLHARTDVSCARMRNKNKSSFKRKLMMPFPHACCSKTASRHRDRCVAARLDEQKNSQQAICRTFHFVGVRRQNLKQTHAILFVVHQKAVLARRHKLSQHQIDRRIKVLLRVRHHRQNLENQHLDNVALGAAKLENVLVQRLLLLQLHSRLENSVSKELEQTRNDATCSALLSATRTGAVNFFN